MAFRKLCRPSDCLFRPQSLAKVASGDGFLIQGGDCAESFDGFETDAVRDTFRVLLQMSLVLQFSGGVPVTKLGRLVKEGRIRSLEEIFLHSMFGPESTRNFQLRPFDFDRSFCVFRPFFWTVFSELRPIKEHQIVDHFFPPVRSQSP